MGPYSQAIVSPPFVFVSGCLGFDPKTGTFVEGSVEAQTRQALQNLKSIVEASGSQVGKIVKTTVRVFILCSTCQIGPVRDPFDRMILYRSS
jgi:enamine deaminase RidA (YjgF/YER057c/UK114 family)